MPKLGFDVNNSKKYKIKFIRNSIIYVSKMEAYLLGLHSLIVWKKFFKEENT